MAEIRALRNLCYLKFTRWIHGMIAGTERDECKKTLETANQEFIRRGY